MVVYLTRKQPSKVKPSKNKVSSMSVEEEFIGRKSQIKSIISFFESDKNHAALVYGRRRVGKTELIKHCLKENSIL